MILSVLYLFLFLTAGFLAARRAVPDAGPAVLVPLGCGFGISMLALFPAVFALPFGFGKTCAALAAASALAVIGVLLYRHPGIFPVPKDKDCGAMWACLLPVVLVTLYLLHTAQCGWYAAHRAKLLRRPAHAPRIYRIHRPKR